MGKFNVLLFGAVMKRTALALALIVPLVISAVAVIWFVKTAMPKTITVPDDYPTIQAAVGNASAGDTVFVRTGIYHESITIDKPLNLVGENPQNTIIIGIQSYQSYLMPAIEVFLGNFTISGLTVKDSQMGIAVRSKSEGKILSCNLLNNTYGIYAQGSLDFVKASGEYISHGSNLFVSGNYIAENEFGLAATNGNVTIHNSTITNNKETLLFWGETFNVYENTIANNQEFGIEFGPSCSNCLVHDNNIEQNGIGIQLNRFPISDTYTIGSGNVVYKNNFINNARQAGEVEQYDYTSPANGTDIVSWNSGTVGNYWSDYHGIDANNDGIGDTPCIIDENNTDYHPLMNPITIPESLDENPMLTNTQPLPTTFIITTSGAAIAGVGLLVYFRKRNYAKINKHSEIEQSSAS
jgi:nitrous oxidase accessory protein NosD